MRIAEQSETGRRAHGSTFLKGASDTLDGVSFVVLP